MLVGEELGLGVLVPEEYGDYGQVISIVDSPTLKEPTGMSGYGDLGQVEIIGTVNKPIVGTTDPASWGRYGQATMPAEIAAARKEIAETPMMKAVRFAKRKRMPSLLIPKGYRPTLPGVPMKAIHAALAAMRKKAQAVQLHSSALLEDVKKIHAMGY